MVRLFLTDRVGENADEVGSDAFQLQIDLTETRKTVDWLEAKVKQEWKRGCPQRGLTNGSLCYVLQKNKANYSTAATSCAKDVSRESNTSSSFYGRSSSSVGGVVVEPASSFVILDQQSKVASGGTM